MIQQVMKDDLVIFTKKIMEDKGVPEYELEIEGQTEKGVNYGSEIVFFSVTSKSNGKKYRFVMKTSKRSEGLREALKDGALDIRENHMYLKVFPAIRKMLAEANSHYQMENIPKTYLVNTEYKHETIIMDDLRSNGYRLWNRTKPMDLNHIQTVLKNYGMYHASSMALSVKEPETFKNLTEDMDNMFKHFEDDPKMKQLLKGYIEDAFGILNEFGLNDIVEKMKELPANFMNIHCKSINEADRITIIHGDCWANNMMFRYENSESLEPLGVCLLDFQISSLGSPATDLSYFLYTSSHEDTITYQFEELLDLYYDSLSSTLKNLGVNPEEVFSYQKLRAHWKKYALTGLIIACQGIKFQLTTQHETPDVNDFGNKQDWTAFRVGDIKDMDSYKKRIVAVFKNYDKYCLN